MPVTHTNRKGNETAPPSAPPQPDASDRRHTAPARAEAFEERYQDILQNIEFGIVRVYRDHPEMTDWEGLAAIEALIRAYRAEAKGRQPTSPPLEPLAQEVYESVQAMCEWRLGREMPFLIEEGEPELPSPKPITLDEMVACLKRVRKSINHWTRRGGRQGYLTFVRQFIP